MKLNEYLKEKKWSVILGVAFLVIFTIIAGVFFYRMDSQFNSLKAQLDRSSNIASLETSSSAIKSSIDGMILKIDGMSQKSDVNTDIQSNSELQSKLEDILKKISELNQEIEFLRIVGETEKQPTKSEDETITEAAEETITETAEETQTEKAEETLAATSEETQTAEEEEIVTVPDTEVPESSAIIDNQIKSANTIKVGQNVTITVKANEVSNLYGYQFNLNYDKKKATYNGSLKSSVSGIGTIFKKDMSDHILVGATMIGDTPGFSGQNVTMCTMEFTANEDLDPSTFTINDVGTVDTNQNYTENISGWSIDLKAK